MIFPLKFSAHIRTHPRIAAAFEVFKVETKKNVEQWDETIKMQLDK